MIGCVRRERDTLSPVREAEREPQKPRQFPEKRGSAYIVTVAFAPLPSVWGS
jgi:hypothetical protein